MKKIMMLIFSMLFVSTNSFSQYVVPNFTNVNPNDVYRSPSNESRLANIDARFGNKKTGNWRFHFYEDGTFSEHVYDQNAYGRIIKDYGEKEGTYIIMEGDDNITRIYLRYRNGGKKTGRLKYYSSSVEFYLSGKVYNEL